MAHHPNSPMNPIPKSEIGNRKSEISCPTYPARPVNGGAMTEDTARPDWAYEPKYNGWRALVHTPSGAMFNRQGERLSIQSEFEAALDTLRHADVPEWLDCEALDRRHGIGRGCLVVLDIIPGSTGVTPAGCGGALFEPGTADYRERRARLRRIGAPIMIELPIIHQPAGNMVYYPPSYQDYEAIDIYQELQAINTAWGAPFYEGLVGKKKTSLYPLQLRSPDQDFAFWQKHRWAF